MKQLRHGDITKHQWGSKKHCSEFCFKSYHFIDFTTKLKSGDEISMLEIHLRN